MKDGPLKYGNGAYIEKVAGTVEMHRLLCPCTPHEPYKFKLSERVRVQVVSDEDSDRTRLSVNPRKSRG